MSLTSYRAAPPRVRVWWIGMWGALWPASAVRAPHQAWSLCQGVGGPGGDLLSHVLRRSTICAEGFHGRVRDGIGCGPLAMTTRSTNRPRARQAVRCREDV